MADDDADKKIKGKFLSFAAEAALATRIKEVAKAEGLSASAWVRSLIIRTFRAKDEAEKKTGEGAP